MVGVAGREPGLELLSTAERARQSSWPGEKGDNRAYWGLLTTSRWPLAQRLGSPYLAVAVGSGSYQSGVSGTEWGLATAAGAGLRVRLGDRASLFVESRLAPLSGITAANGLLGSPPSVSAPGSACSERTGRPARGDAAFPSRERPKASRSRNGGEDAGNAGVSGIAQL